jgi:CheY-like chemotaxis protein
MARVLIVDDHDSVRLTLSSLLQSQGYQVDQASDGLEALGSFSAHPCDAVLMDAYLPQMDGLETCRQLRSQSPVPILILSATDEPTLKRQAIACGANAFLSKPLEFGSLLSWLAAYERNQTDAAC